MKQFETTTAGMVAGLPQPMLTDSPSPAVDLTRLATEFATTYSRLSDAAVRQSFIGFCESNGISDTDTRYKLRDILVNQFNMYKLAGFNEMRSVEESKKALTLESAPKRASQANFTQTGAALGLSRKRRSSSKSDGSTKFNFGVKPLSWHPVGEGLGYADDSDGRGKGLSGGPPTSEFGPRANDGKQSVCQNCREPLSSYGRCLNCNRWDNPIETVKSSNGVPNFGTRSTDYNLTVPGGLIDTNEASKFVVRQLNNGIFEIAYNGAKGTYGLKFADAALRWRLTGCDKHYKTLVPSIVEWLIQDAKNLQEFVIDMANGDVFINSEKGFIKSYA